MANKNIKLFISILSKVLPLRKEVVFMSFGGHYSDSPKAISVELHHRFPKIKQIWLIENDRTKELPPYAKCVDINSYNATYHLAVGAVVVSNAYGRCGLILSAKDNTTKTVSKMKLSVWIHSRRGQLNFSTWHGTPLKRMGVDQVNSKDVDFITSPLVMTHPNQYTLEVMNRITFHKVRHILLGMPRNDLLFHPEKKELIKKKLRIPADAKIVLYAPTFRSNSGGTESRNIAKSGLDQLNEIDFAKLFDSLSNTFHSNNWVFIGRFHYFVEKAIPWDELEKRYPGKIINGNKHDDMADYLLCADVLITDASSSMFDFLLTGKPCFLFFPDVDNYQNNERGFYVDIDKVPFSCAKNFNNLLQDISSFDEEQYRKKVSEFNEKIGVVDDGHSSERVVKYIVNHSALSK